MSVDQFHSTIHPSPRTDILAPDVSKRLPFTSIAHVLTQPFISILSFFPFMPFIRWKTDRIIDCVPYAGALQSFALALERFGHHGPFHYLSCMISTFRSLEVYRKSAGFHIRIEMDDIPMEILAVDLVSLPTLALNAKRRSFRSGRMGCSQLSIWANDTVLIRREVTLKRSIEKWCRTRTRIICGAVPITKPNSQRCQFVVPYRVVSVWDNGCNFMHA